MGGANLTRYSATRPGAILSIRLAAAARWWSRKPSRVPSATPR